MEVTDSEFSRQYQAKQNGELAFVEYSIQERKIFLNATKSTKRCYQLASEFDNI